ncbi:hypothetical protein WMY93_012701 [Mugilogobius chulae]|uniref:Uncharacterized protein n=1 Tax=Mugilogobius chulae TaxID=88201 RepID=A0AAW0P1M7_9GOBI
MEGQSVPELRTSYRERSVSSDSCNFMDSSSSGSLSSWHPSVGCSGFSPLSCSPAGLGLINLENLHHFTILFGAARFENTPNLRQVWEGIRAITDYKKWSPPPSADSPTLAEDLYIFYAHFDRENTDPVLPALPTTSLAPVQSVHVHEVSRVFCSINIRKATGPDGVLGRVLKDCAAELADVFTSVLNISMLYISCSLVAACFKAASIVSLKSPMSHCQGGQEHLLHPCRKHWSPSRVCYEPSALHSVSHDCLASSASNFIVKFVDDTTGFILMVNSILLSTVSSHPERSTPFFINTHNQSLASKRPLTAIPAR